MACRSAKRNASPWRPQREMGASAQQPALVNLTGLLDCAIRVHDAPGGPRPR